MHRRMLQHLGAAQRLGDTALHKSIGGEGRSVFGHFNGLGFTRWRKEEPLSIQRDILPLRSFCAMGGEYQQTARLDGPVQAGQPARPGAIRQVAEQRQHEHHVVGLLPCQRLGRHRRQETVHPEGSACKINGIRHHIRHGDPLCPQRLNQVAGKPAMPTGELQETPGFQQGPVHRLQQQHQLGQGTPAVGQVVAQRVDAGRMACKEMKNVVGRRNLAVQAQHRAEPAFQAVALHQVMRLEPGFGVLARLAQCG